MRTHTKIVIAHHLILHGYGQWLPNDPRGSGSLDIRQEKLASLGPAHFGRKRVQPLRDELRAFHRAAAPKLDFPVLWFDDAMRQALADGIAETVRDGKYTIWACAILRNHVHLCVRRHRDSATEMWQRFALTTATKLRSLAGVSDGHPVWSTRPYKVFLYTPADVHRVIEYIERNPVKETLGEQSWPFVVRYDGWPHARR